MVWARAHRPLLNHNRREHRSGSAPSTARSAPVSRRAGGRSRRASLHRGEEAKSWDLTKDKIFTLSDQTIGVLQT